MRLPPYVDTLMAASLERVMVKLPETSRKFNSTSVAAEAVFGYIRAVNVHE